MPTPYTNLENVKKVMNYRKKKGANDSPMPFRSIAEKMKKNVKTVYGWYLQGTGKRKMRLKI